MKDDNRDSDGSIWVNLATKLNHIQAFGLCIGVGFFIVLGALGALWLFLCFYVWVS